MPALMKVLRARMEAVHDECLQSNDLRRSSLASLVPGVSNRRSLHCCSASPLGKAAMHMLMASICSSPLRWGLLLTSRLQYSRCESVA